MQTKFKHKAFLNNKFMGLGIDFDTYTPYNGQNRPFVFQITILWFRYWVVCYKE